MISTQHHHDHNVIDNPLYQIEVLQNQLSANTTEISRLEDLIMEANKKTDDIWNELSDEEESETELNELEKVRIQIEDLKARKEEMNVKTANAFKNNQTTFYNMIQKFQGNQETLHMLYEQQIAYLQFHITSTESTIQLYKTQLAEANERANYAWNTVYGYSS